MSEVPLQRLLILFRQVFELNAREFPAYDETHSTTREKSRVRMCSKFRTFGDLCSKPNL